MKLMGVYAYKERMEQFLDEAMNVFEEGSDTYRVSRDDLIVFMNAMISEINDADTMISRTDSRELSERLREVEKREMVAEYYKEYAMGKFYDILEKEGEIENDVTKILPQNIVRAIQENNNCLRSLKMRVESLSELEVNWIPLFGSCVSFEEALRYCDEVMNIPFS